MGLSFHRRVLECIEKRERVVVARLVLVEGHAPQEPGAGMIVFSDGTIEFTIGGGPFEAKVISDALKLFEGPERMKQKSYSLTRSSLGMDCAGKATVLLEVVSPPHRLFVFGGGHVGRTLAASTVALGLFEVWVIDDREAFVHPQRHPHCHTHWAEKDWIDGLPPMDSQSFVVVATRCHQTDKGIVKALALKRLAYLGMLGSKVKVATMWNELVMEGIPPSALDLIDAPAGLPIGGKTPGEIAASILAKLVQVRTHLPS
ncbi:XdhC family protein [bacterium]|nr:XdhC family protein [bacterium]